MQNPGLGAIKCWKYVQNTPKNHATCTAYRVWPGQFARQISHTCHAVQVLPALVFTTTNTGVLSAQRPKSQHHKHHGARLGPQQNPRHVEVSKNWKERPNCADDAGPKTSPKPSVAGGKPQKRIQKSPQLLTPQKYASTASKGGLGGMGLTVSRLVRPELRGGLL